MRGTACADMFSLASLLAYQQQDQQHVQSSIPNLFPSVVKYLDSDAYAAEMKNEPSLQLSLERPWKGWRRVEETGKKERIGGLDKEGRWEGNESMRVAVWLQRNSRASRKM